MDEPLYIFEPETFTATLLTVVFALLSVGIVLGMIFIQKKKMSYQANKRKGLYLILLGILFLLTSATGILNFWNSFGFKPVKIYQTAIEMPDATIEFGDIRKAYIYVDKPMTVTAPVNDSLMNYKRLLIVEEFDRTTHVVAEANYPIVDILDKMKLVRAKPE